MDRRTKNPWSSAQDAFLRNNYIKMTRKEMAMKLGRTLDSVNKRLDRHLKLNKDNAIRKSMIGKTFGMLTVTSFYGIKDRKTSYNCKCLCGNEKLAEYNSLVYGNTTSCGCLRRKNLEMTQYKAMYKMYSYAAERRGLLFKLTFKKFQQLTSENCYYCGALPSKKALTSQQKRNGITQERAISVNGVDRKDNVVGYVSNNCVPCCAPCNFMKQDLTEEQFLNRISSIYEYRKES